MLPVWPDGARAPYHCPACSEATEHVIADWETRICTRCLRVTSPPEDPAAAVGLTLLAALITAAVLCLFVL